MFIDRWIPFLDSEGMNIKKDCSRIFISENPNTCNKWLLGGFIDSRKLEPEIGSYYETDVEILNYGRAVSFFINNAKLNNYYSFYIRKGYIYAAVKKTSEKINNYRKHLKEIENILSGNNNDIEKWYQKLSPNSYITYAVISFWLDISYDNEDYKEFKKFTEEIKVKVFNNKYRLTYKDIEKNYDYDKWFKYPNYSSIICLLKWKAKYYQYKISKCHNSKFEEWFKVCKIDKKFKLSFIFGDKKLFWLVNDMKVFEYELTKRENLYIGFGISSGLGIGEIFNFSRVKTGKNGNHPKNQDSNSSSDSDNSCYFYNEIDHCCVDNDCYKDGRIEITDISCFSSTIDHFESLACNSDSDSSYLTNLDSLQDNSKTSETSSESTSTSYLKKLDSLNDTSSSCLKDFNSLQDNNKISEITLQNTSTSFNGSDSEYFSSDINFRKYNLKSSFDLDNVSTCIEDHSEK